MIELIDFKNCYTSKACVTILNYSFMRIFSTSAIYIV